MGPFSAPFRPPFQAPFRNLTDPGLGGGGAAFDPVAAYFSSGEQGVIYDPDDFSTLWQGPGRTNQVTAAGQTVVVMDDKSGNGNHLTLANATVQVDGNGFHRIAFNGLTSIGTTSAIDFTGTDKVTVWMGLHPASNTLGVWFELSAATGSNAGSFATFDSGVGTPAVGLQGVSYAAISCSTVEVLAGSSHVFVAQYDIAGATVTDEIDYRIDTQAHPSRTVAVAGPAGTGNFGNYALHIGARSGPSLQFNGYIYPVIVRGGATSNDEVQAGEEWINERVLKWTRSTASGFALGDSTVAAYLGQNAVIDYVGTAKQKRTLAVPGQTIAQQLLVWESAQFKESADWVVIQVGLNDLDPAEAASVAIARLQTVVTSVRRYSPSTCKVLIAQMTPCRARLIGLYGGVNGPIAYQKWLDMNDAIAGNGATPITGVDGRVTAHVALLNDGSGNLAAAYDIDTIHENNAGREIIGQAWEDALTALGVL